MRTTLRFFFLVVTDAVLDEVQPAAYFCNMRVIIDSSAFLEEVFAFFREVIGLIVVVTIMLF